MSSCDTSDLNFPASFDAILDFFEEKNESDSWLHHCYDDWFAFVELCELFAIDLDGLPVSERELLEARAASDIQQLVDSYMVEYRVFDVHWLLPTKILPWAARFAEYTPFDTFCLRFHSDRDLAAFAEDAPKYLRKDRSGFFSGEPETVNNQLLSAFGLLGPTLPRMQSISIYMPPVASEEALRDFRDGYSLHGALTHLMISISDELQWNRVASVVWPRLEKLELELYTIEEGFFFSEEQTFPKLTFLRFKVHEILDGHDVSSFFQPEQFPHIQEITLGKGDVYWPETNNNILTSEMMQRLCSFPELNRLTLEGWHFDEGALTLFAHEFPANQLNEFVIDNHKLDDEQSLDTFFVEAAKSGLLTQLTALDVRGCSLSFEALERFIEATGHLQLTRCVFQFARFSDRHVRLLLDAGWFDDIRALKLAGDRLTSEGASLLVNSLDLDAMEVLNLTVKNVGQLRLNECKKTYLKQSPEERISHLREKLSSSNHHYWKTLQKEIDGWDDPDYLDGVVLPYLLEHVKDWEVGAERYVEEDSSFALERGTRPISSFWENRLLEEGSFSMLQLVDSVEFDTFAFFERCIHAKDLKHVSSLKIECESLDSYQELTPLFLALPDSAFWKNVRHVTYRPHENATEEELLAFCQALAATGIESLTLEYVKDGREEISQFVQALSESGIFKTLLRLQLHGNHLSDSDIECLTGSACWENLQVLILTFVQGASFSAKSLQAIAHHTPHLRFLKLGDVPLGAGCVSLFLKGGTLRYLEKLELETCGLTPADVSAFGSAELPSLSRLSLNSNEFGTESSEEMELSGDSQLAIVDLLKARFIRQLNGLSLMDTGLGDEEARIIAECKDVEGIEWLSVGVNHFSRAACKVLAASPWIKRNRTAEEWYKSNIEY